MYYFMYICNKMKNIMKKSTLLIALTIALGSYACAPKYTCPAYSSKNVKPEIPTEKPM